MRPKELTIRGLILGALLTTVFTAANVYLGLKVGLTFASSIPLVMQDVGRRYVRRFNDVYGRSGTLWEGRYKATLVDAGPHFLTCQRGDRRRPTPGVPCDVRGHGPRRDACRDPRCDQPPLGAGKQGVPRRVREIAWPTRRTCVERPPARNKRMKFESDPDSGCFGLRATSSRSRPKRGAMPQENRRLARWNDENRI